MSKTYYKKDDPTKIVTIVNSSQDAFYELSNGQMIKKDVFLKYYSVQENIPSVNESLKQMKISNKSNNLYQMSISYLKMKNWYMD